jgi:hypothetical protein
MLILTITPFGQLRVAESDVTKAMPAMTPDVVPAPESEKILTPRMVAFLATPYVLLPMIPAT